MTKNDRVYIRISDEEKKAFHEKYLKDGKVGESFSGWILRKLREACEKIKFW